MFLQRTRQRCIPIEGTLQEPAVRDPTPGRAVELGDLERSLDGVRTRARGASEGVFGPGSAIWQVDREAAIFLGAGRALLMQLAHPWVATAVAEHSTALSDPIARFHRTFQIVFTLVFGSLDQALAAAKRLHRRHTAITGTVPALGVYPAGSPYMANEVSALMWVHGTLVDTAAMAHELVLPRLTSATRDRYYEEYRVLGALFGIPPEAQPRDWAAFTRYVEETTASDRLAVGAAARAIGGAVLAGAGRVPVPRCYHDVTASLLPEPLRVAYGLPFGPREQRRAARALKTVRRIYGALPMRLRFVGPYQEALARLGGRSRPDLLTGWLNRMWIGRPAMDAAARRTSPPASG